MDNQELKELLYNHKYTNEEENEAKQIVEIIRSEGFVGFPYVDAGCPLYINGTHPNGVIRYLAAGDCGFVNIVSIKKNNDEFDYYIIEVGDRGNFSIKDFQERILPEFEARCQKEWGVHADARNCLLYYLMSVVLDDDQRDNCETTSYVLHNGYCLRAVIDEATERYRLEPLVKSGWLYGCGSGFAVDEFMADIAYSKPVYTKVGCPSCHHTWMFDDSKIPDGEKYELTCKKCGTKLMRKKV